MTIRPFKPEDDDAIRSMLAMEGIPADGMQHIQYVTMCMENEGKVVGFFTLRHEWGIPSLQHFCIDYRYRDGHTFRLLAHALLELVGQQRLIVHVGKHMSRIRHFIESCFKVEPYGETPEKYWYMVEVKHG